MLLYLTANKDTDQGVRYSSRGGQVNYNEDENDWGISSEDDKLPVYTKPVVQEEEGDVIESVHDFRRAGKRKKNDTLKLNSNIGGVCFF
jgi:chromodomain-helicase-DNA-binding protein 1